MGLCGRVFAGELSVGDGGGTMRKRKRACLCFVSVSACSILLRATSMQRCNDWFTFYHLSTLNWYKAHTPRRYSGERLGNNKRELDILCLVISQRIAGGGGRIFRLLTRDIAT